MAEQDEILITQIESEYKYGFVTDIEQEFAEKGLTENVIKFISGKKEEPEWMLEWRLNAFRVWQKMSLPEWAHLNILKIDFQDLIYYAAPKKKAKLNSLDEVDPELLKTYEKLGLPKEEQKILAGVAVDFVMDSESVFTTFKEALKEKAIRWLEEIAPEKNTITQGFERLSYSNKNAFDSQAYIQLKKDYCDHHLCLQCAIGNSILKK